MSKGKETRQTIIAKAAPLFNTQGYSGSAMSDIMAATGLKKGGIYNHFTGKDELALAAFDYNWGILRQRYQEALVSAGDSPRDQLVAAIGVHASFADNAPTPGGCPLLNTAIEHDDGHPALRDRAREAVSFWRDLLAYIVARGIDSGEFVETATPKQVAALIISTIEGGIMMGKLFQEPAYIRSAADYLLTYVNGQLLAPESQPTDSV